MPFRAIIFDFDGTLVDTETPWFRAAAEMFEQHGVVLRFADWARGIGTSSDVFDPLTHLGELLGRPIDRPALEGAYTTRVQELLAAEPLRPGALALITEAGVRGLRLAVASSADIRWVGGHLRRFDLLGPFAAICTRDDVVRVKPDPALYLLALERLGVTAAEAFAIEDSPNGAAAAVRAGLPCAVVPNDTTRPLVFPPETVHLETLEGVTLDALCALLGGVAAGSAMAGA